jgi:type III secretion system FlhB-like substrate exporter
MEKQLQDLLEADTASKVRARGKMAVAENLITITRASRRSGR